MDWGLLPATGHPGSTAHAFDFKGETIFKTLCKPSFVGLQPKCPILLTPLAHGAGCWRPWNIGTTDAYIYWRLFWRVWDSYHQFSTSMTIRVSGFTIDVKIPVLSPRLKKCDVPVPEYSVSIFGFRIQNQHNATVFRFRIQIWFWTTKFKNETFRNSRFHFELPNSILPVFTFHLVEFPSFSVDFRI